MEIAAHLSKVALRRVHLRPCINLHPVVSCLNLVYFLALLGGLELLSVLKDLSLLDLLCLSEGHDEKALKMLAGRNACQARNTARGGLWQLARDLCALEKKVSRELAMTEVTVALARQENSTRCRARDK